MATTCYLVSAVSTPDRVSLGTNAANLAGTGVGWAAPLPIRTTRGGGVTGSAATATVTGTTLGIEVTDGTNPLQWISPPLDADVTISGTVTFNVWMSESNMSANVGAQVVVERLDSTGAIVSTVTNSEKAVELAVGPTRLVNNWTATPTSTAFLKGDRIRIRVAGNDGGGTMATGFTFDLGYAGTSAGVDGDSFVSFTETFGFLTTDPTTTTVYPTSTAPTPTITDGLRITREMWTSRGAGITNSISVGNADGWTVPLDNASGHEWFSKPLTAFTLAAPVLVNLRAKDSTGTRHNAVRGSLSVTTGDGTGATIWAETSYPTQLTTTETAYVFYLAGDDLAITDGQRLRFRWYDDDESTTPMVGSGSVTVQFAGTSGGASGDTFLTFGQSLTEYVPAVAGGINIRHPAPPHMRKDIAAGPPILMRQQWLDYTGPSTVAANIDTAGQLSFTGGAIGLTQSQAVSPGAITFAGQSLAFVTTVNVVAGQLAFTGGDLAIVIDVPRQSAVFPVLPGLRLLVASPRGPPVLAHQRFDSYAAGTVTTTVDVSTAGALTLTGQAVAFTQTQSVAAGSLTFTGQTVGVVSTVNVGTAGALTLTGASLALSQSQQVVAGAVTFTGQSIALQQSQSATAGQVTFTGSTVTTITATVVSVTTAGQVTFTGQSVAFTQTQAIVAGQVTFTGSAVGLSQAQAVSAGAVAFTGQTLGLTLSVPVSTAGAVLFTGQTTPTTQTQQVTAGAITFTGSDITLVTSQPTTSAVFPQLPILKVGFRGPPILARQRFDAPAPAITTTVDVSVTGQVTFTGSAIGLSQSQSVTAGQVTLTGQSVAFRTTVAVTAGAITFTGQTVGASGTTTVNVTAGALTFTGQSLGLTRVTAVSGGQVTFSGQTVGVSVALAITSGAITFSGSAIAFTTPVPIVDASSGGLGAEATGSGSGAGASGGAGSPEQAASGVTSSASSGVTGSE